MTYRDKDKKPIHIVSAWASKAKAVFGQLATEEKSNEITAVPLLPELLDIKGTIITANAVSVYRIDRRAIYRIARRAISRPQRFWIDR